MQTRPLLSLVCRQRRYLTRISRTGTLPLPASTIGLTHSPSVRLRRRPLLLTLMLLHHASLMLHLSENPRRFPIAHSPELFAPTRRALAKDSHRNVIRG